MVRFWYQDLELGRFFFIRLLRIACHVRGPFLERPGNFSGNFDLEFKHGKHKTAFRARKGMRTFEKRAPGPKIG